MPLEYVDPGPDLYNHMIENLWNLLPPSPVHVIGNDKIDSLFRSTESENEVPENAITSTVDLSVSTVESLGDPTSTVGLFVSTVESLGVPASHVKAASSIKFPVTSTSTTEDDAHVADDSAVVDAFTESESCDSEDLEPISGDLTPSSQCQRSRFFSLDPSMVQRVKELKRGKSHKNNNWAINWLNAWRSEVGKDLTPIDQMEYGALADDLLQFFLCICKDNGQRYPSGSIRNFHRSFNRILRDAQRVRIAQTKVNEEPFCIETNPYFLEVSAAVVASMEKSRDSGVNKARRKPKCLSFAEEALILNHESQSLQNNVGVLKRILWFNTSYFMIRGNKEMHKLKYKDFTQGVDDYGRAYVE